MLNKAFWLALKTWGSALTLAMGLGACAVMPANGADSWREEVLLHDGQKIIVERSVQRGGRAEVGQQGSYVNQTMRFKMPGNGQSVEWRDELSPDLGNSSFLPMALDVVKGLPYLVVYPMGCLAYNKWGRPNPPYVVFKYDEKTWQRILLDGLPAEIKMPNLIFSDPDNVVKRLGTSDVSAQQIQKIVGEYRQSEFKSILREAIANPSPGCGVMFSNRKGQWQGSDWFTDKPNLQACESYCRAEGYDESNCPCKKLFERK